MWVGVLKVTAANLLLSFDNAIMIALVASGVPAARRRKTVFLGVILATVILLLLAPVGIYLLSYPYLRFIGGLALMWIAIKLLLPPDGEGDRNSDARSTVLGALQAIAVANLVRSIDNVIGVAAAADGSLGLLVVGLVLSVPVLSYGSVAMVALVERFPALTVLGAAFIGFLAGQMIASDAVVEMWASHHLNVPGWHTVVAAMSAGLVVLLGKVTAHVMQPLAVPVKNRHK